VRTDPPEEERRHTRASCVRKLDERGQGAALQPSSGAFLLVAGHEESCLRADLAEVVLEVCLEIEGGERGGNSESGRIRNELQTRFSQALEYDGDHIRVRFDRIDESVMPLAHQEALRGVLAWYEAEHPVWFGWLDL
jgi:hypothetical protein